MEARTGIEGGAVDLYKSATTLLNDYRQGLLGSISLESPVSREIMLKKLVDRQTEEASQE